MATNAYTFDKFPTTAKDAHYKRARIYPKTRVGIRQKTSTMFVASMRDYPGLHAPTKKTSPPFRKRRYSIDVNTEGWNREKLTGGSGVFSDDVVMENTDFATPEIKHQEIELPVLRQPFLSLPDPHRRIDMQRFRLTDAPKADFSTYLELDNSSLTNEDFNLIMDLKGSEAWFRDSILDVALELLSKQYTCKENLVEIANSMVTLLLFHVGRDGDTDENDFANYNEEKKRFHDKHFIFLPINDGYISQDASAINGTHWSFVVVNRLRGEAHYLDSYFSANANHRRVAWCVVQGLGLLLSEEYHFQTEFHVPHQWRTNREERDVGPCGPFVYAMIRIYLKYIRYMQDGGEAYLIDLRVPSDFAEGEFWNFNSRDVRWKIRTEIAYARLYGLRDRLIAEHDRAALQDVEGVVVHQELEEEKDWEERRAATTKRQRAEQGTHEAREAQEVQEAQEESDISSAETDDKGETDNGVLVEEIIESKEDDGLEEAITAVVKPSTEDNTLETDTAGNVGAKAETA